MSDPVVRGGNDSVSRPVRLLRRDEAATYVRETHGVPCSTRTLAKLASLGGGPRYRRAGLAAMYSPEGLDAWVTSRLGPEVSSTAELPLTRKGARHAVPA